MESERELLIDLCERENKENIYSHLVLGAPLWRIIRFKSRVAYLKKRIGFEYNTTKVKLRPFIFIGNILYSFYSFCLLFVKRRYKVDNFIFAFPRLQKIDNNYWDKFTDPVIMNSDLSKSYLIFQRPLTGSHKLPRINNDKTIRTDFLEIYSRFIGFVMLPFIVVRYYNQAIQICKKSVSLYESQLVSLFSVLWRVSVFVAQYSIYYALFKWIKPRNVLLVDREIFFPVILACKKLGINTFELQHGITLGETPLYSGTYDKSIDPDYFLTFGSFWLGPQFGMDLNHMVNIGWAYSLTLNHLLSTSIKSTDAILVISAPHITNGIINATVMLAQAYPANSFDIRLHPQERLTEDQIKTVAKFGNVKVVENTIESSVAIASYKHIIGENSSVLYEALSMGKNVGIICFGEFVPESLGLSNIFPFTYIASVDDFSKFLNNKREFSKDNSIYSDFNAQTLNNLISR